MISQLGVWPAWGRSSSCRGWGSEARARTAGPSPLHLSAALLPVAFLDLISIMHALFFMCSYLPECSLWLLDGVPL